MRGGNADADASEAGALMVIDGTVIIPLMLVAAVLLWLACDRPKNGGRE